MQLFLKILSEMANSVNPDQTAPLIWVYTVCMSILLETGVRNFWTFTVLFFFQTKSADVCLISP